MKRREFLLGRLKPKQMPNRLAQVKRFFWGGRTPPPTFLGKIRFAERDARRFPSFERLLRPPLTPYKPSPFPSAVQESVWGSLSPSGTFPELVSGPLHHSGVFSTRKKNRTQRVPHRLPWLRPAATSGRALQRENGDRGGGEDTKLSLR